MAKSVSTSHCTSNIQAIIEFFSELFKGKMYVVIVHVTQELF
jgi:hypothetical protein